LFEFRTLNKPETRNKQRANRRSKSGNRRVWRFRNEIIGVQVNCISDLVNDRKALARESAEVGNHQMV
jgi:hypothetical protein